jgi:hypothetical protein
VTRQITRRIGLSHSGPRIGAVLLALASLISCARRPQMEVSSVRGSAVRPSVGEALVLFIRPHRYVGKAISSALYDGEEFLGLLTDNTAVAHQMEPGRHTFMLLCGVPAGVAFLDADLEAGKTYYVELAVRSKWTRPYLWLVPIDPAAERGQLSGWLAEANLLVIDDYARRWEAENRTEVAAKRAEGLASRRLEAEPHRLDSSFAATLPVNDAEGTRFSSSSKPEREGDRTPASNSTADRLRELDRLRREGLVTEGEYRDKRRAILGEL